MIPFLPDHSKKYASERSCKLSAASCKTYVALFVLQESWLEEYPND
jgi:hypothetical protein